MSQKKMSLRNQIFITMLLLITLILILVHITFLVMFMSNDTAAFSVAELIIYFKRKLFWILLLAVVLSAFVSYKVANSISKPITELSHRAEKMTNLDFSPSRMECTSPEIEILNNKLNEMAEQINCYYSERNSLLQNISHELKTPLMSIHGYAEAVREGIEDDVHEAMTIIMEESEHLTEMVSQLLILSRKDAFIGQPEHSDLRISDEVIHTIRTLDGIAFKNGVSLSYNIRFPNLVCHISSDVLRIILSNLISNSLRYAKETVAVELTREEAFAVITVIDDGGGISPNRIEHIFERNYTGEGGNFGLGLHIVEKLLESVSGSVAVCNLLKGSCFTVKIPLIM